MFDDFLLKDQFLNFLIDLKKDIIYSVDNFLLNMKSFKLPFVYYEALLISNVIIKKENKIIWNNKIIPDRNLVDLIIGLTKKIILDRDNNNHKEIIVESIYKFLRKIYRLTNGLGLCEEKLKIQEILNTYNLDENYFEFLLNERYIEKNLVHSDKKLYNIYIWKSESPTLRDSEKIYNFFNYNDVPIDKNVFEKRRFIKNFK